VKYTADLGPFESKWNRFFAKLYLQHAVDMILARSQATQKELAKLGITTPVKICPDTAFLLATSTSEFARDLRKQRIRGPIIGFSVSHMASKQSRDPKIYVRSMAALADYALENTGAQIILIGNEFSSDKLLDDGYIAEEILKNMVSKDKALIAPCDLTAQQLKDIICQCDVVIAARYHSIIASLSQGIPVLAVSWHDKYAGVLGIVGQERYVCSLKSLTLEDDLKDRFDQLWRSRNYIHGAISIAIPQIREAIFEGGNQVSLLLASKRTRYCGVAKRSL
jgi:polysaccharide pyruvyl transferase WcaK-like protein